MDASMAGKSEHSVQEKKKSTKYRQNLKLNNPVKYAEYLAKQRERVKKRREELKHEKTSQRAIRERELVKLQNAKYRERKAEMTEKKEKLTVKLGFKFRELQKPDSRQTRNSMADYQSQIEKRREYWKIKQHEYRKYMTPQKKAIVRAKDRKRKMEKKIKGQTGKNDNEQTVCAKDVTNKVSEEFSSVSQHNTGSNIDGIEQVEYKEFMKEVDLKQKHSGGKSCENRKLLVRRYRNKMGEQQKARIRSFYIREDISRPLPDKRYATKKYGPAYILQSTLKLAFSKYKEEHPGDKLCLSKFTLLKPKNVKTLDKGHRDFCLCVYCSNIKYKLTAINRLLTKRKMNSKVIKNESDLLQILLCAKSDANRFYKPLCINGKCSICADYSKTLNDYLSDLMPSEETCHWNKWERKTFKNGQKRITLVTKEGTLSELLSEMKDDVCNPVKGTSFVEHMFNYTWQYHQFHELKKNLKYGHVLFIMDFGRNRILGYQDEIKSVHYNLQQATIHPIVMFYRKNSTDEHLTRSAFIVISDDIAHDSHAVNHYTHTALNYLRKEEVEVKKLSIYSDGCCSQYKGKGAFADLSFMPVETDRNYFGSEHGKCEGDAEIGIISKALDLAVSGRKRIVATPNQLFEFCSETMTKDELFLKRVFHYVKSEEIDRSRPDRNVNTLPGTRKLHQIKNTGENYKVAVRKNSCHCNACLSGGECPNKEYSEEWKTQSLKVVVTGNSGKKILKQTEEEKQEIEEEEDGGFDSNTEILIENEVTNNGRVSDNKASNECHSNKYSCSESLGESIQVKSQTRIHKIIEKLTTASRTLKRKSFFKLAQTELSGEDFSTIEAVSVSLEENVKDQYPLEVTRNLSYEKLTVDQPSVELMPNDVEGVIPYSVCGDGNCLYRAASVHLFENEQNHIEIRIRTAMELAAHSDLYLNDDFLKKTKEGGTENIVRMYANFSPFSVHDDKINELYEKEVRNMIFPNQYSGAWQVHALAEVMQCQLIVIYPQYGGHTVRTFLGGRFSRRNLKQSDKEDTRYIMWTNTRGKKAPEKNWVPNHFVPCQATLRPKSDKKRSPIKEEVSTRPIKPNIPTKATALYPFESGGEGELSFGDGDVMTVISQDVGDGWWEVKNSRGQTGLVPESYFEILEVPEPQFSPPPLPPPTAARASWSQPAASQQPTGQMAGARQSAPAWNQQPPAHAMHQQPPVAAAAAAPPSMAKQSASQDSYDDWDDDWSDDDSSTTTERNDNGSGSTANNKKDKNKEADKFGTVRKPFSKFSNFTKQGGEAYLFGSSNNVTVPSGERFTSVIETDEGPCWQALQNPFTCVIASPKKESKFHGMKSFIAYQITPSFSGIQVSRRYKHFDWLHKQLEEKFTTVAVPPLPDKQVTGRFEDDFIQGRMFQLQMWIDRLCTHPAVAYSEVFNHFLSCTDEKKWKEGKRRSEKDEFQGGKWFLTLQSPPQRLDPIDTEMKLDRFGKYVKNMEDSVRHLLSIGESNSKKHQGPFRKEYNKMGGSFVALAKSFEFDERPSAQGLTQAVEQTGRTYEEIGKLFSEQPKNDLLPLLTGLLEYKGILSTFPDVLNVYRAASAKIHENAGRLSDEEMSEVQGRADVIAYATLAEMNHFQQHRVTDFKAMMQEYLRGQIQFYKAITGKLEGALEQLERS